MFADSILGRVYACWLESWLFHLLQSLWRPLVRAFDRSATAHLLRRERRGDRFAESALVSLLGALWAGLCRLCRSGGESLTLRLLRPLSRGGYELLLGLFVCGMFLLPHTLWNNAYCLAGAALLFVLYGLMAALGLRRTVRLSELGLPFFLFAAACVLSLGFTGDMGDSLRVVSFFISAFLLSFVVLGSCSERPRLMGLMGWLYAATLLTSLYALLQRVQGVEVSSSFTDLALNAGMPGRVFSTLDNPNNFAEFLVLFTPLSAAFAMNQRRGSLRLLLSLLLVFPFAALVMTYCRAGWLSILLAALIFCYCANKRLLPLLAVAGLLCIPLLPATVLNRFLTIFNQKDSSANFRLIVWEGVTRLLRDRGLTGIGLGPASFAAIYPEYSVNPATNAVCHSQMLYMELLLETGLLGFVSFFWLILGKLNQAALAIGRKGGGAGRNALIACLAAFLGLGVLSVFEYIWFYPRILFAYFILFGILLAALRLEKGNGEG